ncbi:hypothetical protein BT69DRAFT_897438 [Atractiella rhizophila]|nr:hypothetical protein BT69DRAFT_897438 [Atractiella rhizophila]
MDSLPRSRSLRRLYSSSDAETTSKLLQRTGKRPGQNLADAAAQAEWNEKRWVWVPDEKEGYIAGWIIQEETVENERGEMEEVCTVGMVNDQVCTSLVIS